MYTQLIKVIYKTQINSSLLYYFNKKILKKYFFNITRLGSYYLFTANTRLRNHVPLKKQTNAVMQWNLWIWGLQLNRLQPQKNSKQFLHNLYFFYQLTGAAL